MLKLVTDLVVKPSFRDYCHSRKVLDSFGASNPPAGGSAHFLLDTMIRWPMVIQLFRSK